MSGIIALLRTLAEGGGRAYFLLAALGMGFYVVARGRKAAAVEQAEESRERRVA